VGATGAALPQFHQAGAASLGSKVAVSLGVTVSALLVGV